MLSIFKTVEGRMTPIDSIEKGSWVSLIEPTAVELQRVSEELSIDPAFLRAALDEEETSRVEFEDNRTLIIVDLPTLVVSDGSSHYSTLPLGIVVTEDNLVTVCLRNNPILTELASGDTRGTKTSLKTRFIFIILLKIATRFLQYIRQIDKITNTIEHQLYKSQLNKELIKLLDMQKSLVYFSTSLKGNESTLEKILRGRVIKIYEEDQDLLEDVLIEVRQAIEMVNIYSSILSGTMDAFASVISNNLNVTMKMLTSLTIIITIPNIIFSFYGMNVPGLPLPSVWFPSVISAGIMISAVLVLKKLRLF